MQEELEQKSVAISIKAGNVPDTEDKVTIEMKLDENYDDTRTAGARPIP